MMVDARDKIEKLFRRAGVSISAHEARGEVAIRDACGGMPRSDDHVVTVHPRHLNLGSQDLTSLAHGTLDGDCLILFRESDFQGSTGTTMPLDKVIELARLVVWRQHLLFIVDPPQVGLLWPFVATLPREAVRHAALNAWREIETFVRAALPQTSRF